MEKATPFHIVREDNSLFKNEFDSIRVASEQLKIALDQERKKKEALESTMGEIQSEYEDIIRDTRREKFEIAAQKQKLEKTLESETQRGTQLEKSIQSLQAEIKKIHEQLAATQTEQKKTSTALQAVESLTQKQIQKTNQLEKQFSIYSTQLQKWVQASIQKTVQTSLKSVKGWISEAQEQWDGRVQKQIHHSFNEVVSGVKTQIEHELHRKKTLLEDQIQSLEQKLAREVQVLFNNQNLIQNGHNHMLESVFQLRKENLKASQKESLKESEDTYGFRSSSGGTGGSREADEIPSYRRSTEYIQERLARLRKEEGTPAPQAVAPPTPAVNPPEVAHASAAPESPRVVTPPPFRGKRPGPKKAIPTRPQEN